MKPSKLPRLHLQNMARLLQRANVSRQTVDYHERRLHLEVVEKHLGGRLPPYLVALEWSARDQFKGDLVFCDRMCTTAVVVEVKHISPTASALARESRLHKVRNQALVYKSKWERMHPTMYVYACTYTNFDGLVYLTGGDDYSI